MAQQNFDMSGIRLVEAFGFLSGWESVALSVFVKAILPAEAKIVNVGAGVGTSSLSMALAKNGIDITTVDISIGGPLGGLENERNAFKFSPYLPLPKQVLSDSYEAGKTWTGGLLDFVFIDGDHLAAGLERDIVAWLPHIKEGGYIGFHDYDSDKWGDVKKTIDRYMNPALFKKILHVDTIAIYQLIKPGSDIPVDILERPAETVKRKPVRKA